MAGSGVYDRLGPAAGIACCIGGFCLMAGDCVLCAS
jgi:hypothetical protein